MEDRMKLRGDVTLIHRGKAGEEKSKEEINNLIVTAGKVYLAKLLGKIETVGFDYIQIGTGTTAANATDTTLATYYAEVQDVPTYEADNKTLFDETFSFTEAVAVTEAGIFNGVHAGPPTMLSRVVFAVKNMANGETLQVIWRIQQV